jgi:oleate hydratase
MKKENQKAYLIGGGIASLASAVYLIRDGKFDGKNIFIFEEGNDIGGSLDGKAILENRYLSRGQRMFTKEVYNCTLDLLSFIPLEKNTQKTLLDDFIDFNNDEKVKWKVTARLVEKGKIIDASDFGLSVTDKLNIIKMFSLPEYSLGGLKISDIFPPSFFKTNFWFMFCTTFAFQPWHSAIEVRRYALRFIQELPRISTMSCVCNTRYNQYDSMILPIINWLKERGVIFLMRSRVISLKFTSTKNGKERVEKITYSEKGKNKELFLSDEDLVFLTNGSMTTNSSLGSMRSVPLINTDIPHDSWAIWKDISKNRAFFGNPAVFNSQIDKSKWESFSVTFKDKTFSDLMENFSKNKPGTGGITTIKDSNWLISVITPAQPHFLNQPGDINVFWGYALFPDKEGNYVHKKMSECTGEEIMIEVCSHLGFTKELPKILESSDCIPCIMPYITSQFMPRKRGDRPNVIPKGTSNFAFIGQFCEIPNEIVFTVEQSVRSAMIAVYGLLGIKKDIPSIYQGQYDPKVAKEWLKMGFDLGLAKLIPNRKSAQEEINKEYKPIEFPKDESVHDYIVEWWYFNGHLKDKDENEYSFMDCLFKVDVKKVKIPFLSKIPLKTSYFSHSLVSDLKNKNFIHRINPFSLISDDSFSKHLLYINYINPTVRNSYTNCVIEKISNSVYHLKNEDINLKLTLIKEPLLEGGNGFLNLHSKTTYYYSLTNLKTEGRIKIKDKWVDVTGKSWMDHQWADAKYSKDKWDWFSVQLDNDTEMVCCMYDDGKTKTYFADVSHANGRQEHFKEVEIIPLKKHWISPKSKAVYPLEWKIKIPARNIDLNLTAKIENQEMLFGSINYWEGPLRVDGLFENKKVKGVGFMELVGYLSKYGNVKYIKDGFGETFNWFISVAKNKASNTFRLKRK